MKKQEIHDIVLEAYDVKEPDILSRLDFADIESVEPVAPQIKRRYVAAAAVYVAACLALVIALPHVIGGLVDEPAPVDTLDPGSAPAVETHSPTPDVIDENELIDEFMEALERAIAERRIKGTYAREDCRFINMEELRDETGAMLFKFASASCDSFVFIGGEVYRISDPDSNYGMISAVPCNFDGDDVKDILFIEEFGYKSTKFSVFNMKSKSYETFHTEREKGLSLTYKTDKSGNARYYVNESDGYEEDNIFIAIPGDTIYGEIVLKDGKPTLQVYEEKNPETEAFMEALNKAVADGRITGEYTEKRLVNLTTNDMRKATDDLLFWFSNTQDAFVFADGEVYKLNGDATFAKVNVIGVLTCDFDGNGEADLLIEVSDTDDGYGILHFDRESGTASLITTDTSISYNVVLAEDGRYVVYDNRNSDTPYGEIAAVNGKPVLIVYDNPENTTPAPVEPEPEVTTPAPEPKPEESTPAPKPEPEVTTTPAPEPKPEQTTTGTTTSKPEPEPELNIPKPKISAEEALEIVGDAHCGENVVNPLTWPWIPDSEPTCELVVVDGEYRYRIEFIDYDYFGREYFPSPGISMDVGSDHSYEYNYSYIYEVDGRGNIVRNDKSFNGEIIEGTKVGADTSVEGSVPYTYYVYTGSMAYAVDAIDFENNDLTVNNDKVEYTYQYYNEDLGVVFVPRKTKEGDPPIHLPIIELETKAQYDKMISDISELHEWYLENEHYPYPAGMTNFLNQGEEFDEELFKENNVYVTYMYMAEVYDEYYDIDQIYVEDGVLNFKLKTMRELNTSDGPSTQLLMFVIPKDEVKDVTYVDCTTRIGDMREIKITEEEAKELASEYSFIDEKDMLDYTITSYTSINTTIYRINFNVADGKGGHDEYEIHISSYDGIVIDRYINGLHLSVFDDAILGICSGHMLVKRNEILDLTFTPMTDWRDHYYYDVSFKLAETDPATGKTVYNEYTFTIDAHDGAVIED